mmetsp:Transcript_47855/g.40475  ORF Transcript_47855/g.40475 Transcript_47855/m.40475 type:complete len:227 (+) Transcript_47855:1097-1777(+)
MLRFKEKVTVKDAAADEAAAKKKEEDEAAAAKKKKEDEEAAKKKEEEDAKKKEEDGKKQVDAQKEIAEKALVKNTEDMKKLEEAATKKLEDDAKLAAEALVKDEANNTSITGVLTNAKQMRIIMDEDEFRIYMDKLYTLQTKTLKRQMQEQAINDLTAMIGLALNDPLIGTKKSSNKQNKSISKLKRGAIDYAINKMTEEVYNIESKIEKATQILNDIKSIVQVLI